MGFSLAALKAAKDKGVEYKPEPSKRGRKSLGQSFRPKHIDEKLSQLEHKIVSSSVYYTTEGVRFVSVYDEEGKYRAKIFDVEYNVLNEEVFDSVEECSTCIAELMEDINLEDNSMLTIIKDVMKRVNLATDEMLFVFRLLTDPDERKEYVEDKIEVEEDDEPKPRGYNLRSKKVYQSSGKRRGRPLGKKKSFTLDSLMGEKEKKMGANLKHKIKNLTLNLDEDDD